MEPSLRPAPASESPATPTSEPPTASTPERPAAPISDPPAVPPPDPLALALARDRGNFRLAQKITLGFLALLWLMQLLNFALDLEPAAFGVRPREWSGLIGILLAPLQHGGFAHLASNTLPLFVLGTAMLYLYPNASLRVIPAVYVGPGIAVWLLGRASAHLGASGLVYGLVGYIFVAGVIRRDRRAIAASLLVAFMYGALVWGMLPIRPEMSWETHLAAGLIGVAMAFALRHLDPAPRPRPLPDDDGDEIGGG